VTSISLSPAARHDRVGTVISAVFVVVCLALVAAGVLTGLPLTFVMLLVAAVLAMVWHRFLLSWPTLLAGIALLIILVPIRHYELPGSLPIQLEPYRVVVAFLAVAWIASALIDPRIRFRRTGGVIDRPLAIFLAVVLLSVFFNLSRVSSVGPDVVKGLLFFGSFVVVLFLVASLLRRHADIERIVSVIVLGMVVVAVFALFESRTGRNAFLGLDRVIPILKATGEIETLERGARLRAFGSAQHPIAMGAAFAMTIPLALSLAIARRQARWWLAAGAVMIGAVSTVSRTAILMIVVVGLVFLWLRPEMKRFWPFIVPVIVATHFALPGTLGTIKKSFFPAEGLIAQQQDAAVGSGRLATLGPALREEFVPNPLFGEGFATRVTKPNRDVPVANAPILDNQWLGILLETGVAGALSLLWLFLRFIRRMGHEAKQDPSARGWLLVGITASVAAYGVGMFTFDAFSFIQVTFLLFIVIGLGCAAFLAGRHDSGNDATEAVGAGGRFRPVANGPFSRVAYRAPRAF
jgi:O-antigen ligase